MNRRAFLQLVLGANVAAPPDRVLRLYTRVDLLERVALMLFNDAQRTEFAAQVRQALTNARLARLEALITDETLEDDEQRC